MDQLAWLRVSAVLIVCGLVVAAWKWIPIAALDLDEISAWLAPHRHAWYALPMVMLAFIVLALRPRPAADCRHRHRVRSGARARSTRWPDAWPARRSGFAIGRWLGRRRVEQLGGERIARVTRALKRNGTLAVFLVRKVPAPFTLANIVVGASTVGYRDFVLGTLLGMGAIVIALAGFGYQLTMVLRNPSPTTVDRARRCSLACR